MSRPARLERSFEFDGPTRSAQVYEWYQEQLTELGWTKRSAEIAVEMDVAQFFYTDGNRVDIYSISAGFF